ncbi:MAG: polyphosphate kinase 2 family protein [Cytophagaceae bacterium]|jgi:PPK2 family polyphosphate:nucleotide phosphotransferase|nr:polyphosphate kinase 2 family protein [Cytophagaceae bacterium]
MAVKKDKEKRFFQYLESLRVPKHHKVSLKKEYATHFKLSIAKELGEEALEKGIALLSELQDKLYAHNQHSVLIVLQAMDAAGKDGAIKHVMSGLNPQGVKVYSFKAPNSTELDHNYLWRHFSCIPARGEIVLFNRSHYENVLVTKVHPEYILKENIPGIEQVSDIKKDFWTKRYDQINQFEKTLHENGTLILKFFLHVSKAEQKKRFLERIDNPAKNWKFSPADIAERGYWDEYQKAYEQAIEATSTAHAPWFIIPADDKWATRLCIAGIIYKEFEKLGLEYPSVSKAQRAELMKIRQVLLDEDK